LTWQSATAMISHQSPTHTAHHFANRKLHTEDFQQFDALTVCRLHRTLDAESSYNKRTRLSAPQTVPRPRMDKRQRQSHGQKLKQRHQRQQQQQQRQQQQHQQQQQQQQQQQPQRQQRQQQEQRKKMRLSAAHGSEAARPPRLTIFSPPGSCSEAECLLFTSTTAAAAGSRRGCNLGRGQTSGRTRAAARVGPGRLCPASRRN